MSFPTKKFRFKFVRGKFSCYVAVYTYEISTNLIRMYYNSCIIIFGIVVPSIIPAIFHFKESFNVSKYGVAENKFSISKVVR